MKKGDRRRKLTEDNVRAIRRKFLDGVENKEMAKEYGVNAQTIVSVILRETWKHIND